MASDLYKDAALAVLEPDDDEFQVELEAPPALEAEFIVCPACGCHNCEPSPDSELSQEGETYVVNCPQCSAQFSPPRVVESKSRQAVIAVYERRLRLRRAANGGTMKNRDVAKSEAFRLLSR